ncbi:MAG: peptidylprolyl isomerase [Acidimicrobiales bacterium]
MGTEKRERQRAGRISRIEQAEAEARRRVARRRVTAYGTVAAVVLAVIVAVIVISGGNDGDDGDESTVAGHDPSDDAATPTPDTPAAGDVTDATGPSGPLPVDFEPFSGTGALSDTIPALRNAVYTAPPDLVIDTANTYEAVITTTKGTMRITLFDDAAPVTVNNFVGLARDGFYDGVAFHRVIDDFMAQTGDPTGTGAGGPGYQFEDEFDPDLTFDRRGLVAMANAGPGTNGSQFFITFVPTPWLDGLHTIFGELLDGDDVLGRLLINDGRPGVGADLIESIEILES